MRFRLTYEGDIKHNGGANHVHEIRRKFHHQLKRLWEINPTLSWRNREFEGNVRRTTFLSDNFKVGNYRFVPIASDIHKEYDEPPPLVSLDILFLRSGPPGQARNQGDIDNRLNTIFDALKMPTSIQDLGTHTNPEENENPFHVLMQDDKMVANVSITTDTLLEPTPGHEYYSTHDARLVILVAIDSRQTHC